MKKITLGILAHVDAGKTTLNESFLYHGNIIRKKGRVDHKDSYLDFDEQEKERGITIYSKNATFDYGDLHISLLDTPGHTDFSSEMERVLQVLDEAVIVISGLSGVQSHTKTIWNLTEVYRLPVFFFVNKMDITTRSREELFEDLQKQLGAPVVDFSSSKEEMYEKIALADEETLNEYLESGSVSDERISLLIKERKIFPVCFGSALKDEGVVELLDTLSRYSSEKEYPKQFGLKIYKVSYDENGNRLLYGKVTGGELSAKQKIGENEKVDQLFAMSGKRFTLVSEASAGDIVAIKGLSGHYANEGLGAEKSGQKPLLSSYMNYRITYPKQVDSNQMTRELRKIEEENPEIRLNVNGYRNETYVELMGDLQIDVIRNIIKKRTGVDVSFDNGSVLYKETIRDSVIGVGHFEPLRHYAEVHLRLKPLARDSGLVFKSDVSTDELSLNWQRLILTHLREKVHKGVLTGSPITDMEITLVAGRAHLKHTEGGDFRQATYRAVRNGLKKADSILLEPYYSYHIDVPQQDLSKVLYDLESLSGSVRVEEDTDVCHIYGEAPVVNLKNYQTRLASLSSGRGQISLRLCGYRECHNTLEVLEHFSYDSEMDFANPTGSVFCAHGAGFYVPYNHVEDFMHIREDQRTYSRTATTNRNRISEEELKRVFANLNGRNRKADKVHERDKKEEEEKKKVKIAERKPELLLVDGYNVMHYFSKTKDLLEVNFDMARDMVINEMANLAGYKNCDVVIVFDAYKVAGGLGSIQKSDNVTVVYTKANQTADSYIEKAVHDYSKDYSITVATSDYAVQNMILNSGARRISSRELEMELEFYRTNTE